MKTAKWPVAIVLVLAATWLMVDGTEEASKSVNASPLTNPAPLAQAIQGSKAPVPRTPNATMDQTSSATSKELASLDEMAWTVSQFTRPEHNITELVERMQKSGQEPKVYRDANPDSGEMIIVRGDSPLPGTRYFHAQYFTDDAGERFVQHMSFEFKPAPDAMQAAIAAVEKNFPGLASPTHKREDYVRWKLGEHKIVWVKRLSDDDMAHDPFNAYGPEDRGAVRVAVEDDIHAD